MTTATELPNVITLNITKYDIAKAQTEEQDCPTEIALNRWLKQHSMSNVYPSVGVSVTQLRVYGGNFTRVSVNYKHEDRLINHVIMPYDGDSDTAIKAGKYKLTKKE